MEYVNIIEVTLNEHGKKLAKRSNYVVLLVKDTTTVSLDEMATKVDEEIGSFNVEDFITTGFLETHWDERPFVLSSGDVVAVKSKGLHQFDLGKEDRGLGTIRGFSENLIEVHDYSGTHAFRLQDGVKITYSDADGVSYKVSVLDLPTDFEKDLVLDSNRRQKLVDHIYAVAGDYHKRSKLKTETLEKIDKLINKDLEK